MLPFVISLSVLSANQDVQAITQNLAVFCQLLLFSTRIRYNFRMFILRVNKKAKGLQHFKIGNVKKNLKFHNS